MSYYGENSDGTGQDVRDHIQNEIDRQEHQEAHEQTPWGKIEKMACQIRSLEVEIRAYRSQRVDSGAEVADKIATAKAQIEVLKAQKTALHTELDAQEREEQDAEWTLEVTIARRAEWNKAAQANPKWKQYKMQTATGYKMDTLKHYIAKWEL